MNFKDFKNQNKIIKERRRIKILRIKIDKTYVDKKRIKKEKKGKLSSTYL